MAITKIVATQDTWVKKTTQQASDLPDKDKQFKPRNSVLAVNQTSEVAETSHLKLDLADDPGSNWYVFGPHWNIVEADGSAVGMAAGAAAAKPLPPSPPSNQVSIVINWNDFNDKVSEFFTVGELTNYDRRRIPQSADVKRRLIAIATELDKIRKEWGGPIRITSGYRPEPINRQVGGVSNSRHVFGDAVDIAPINGNIAQFQKWLDQHWFGALGYGARRGFVHLDMRNGNGWKRGGSKGARWNY